MVSHLPSYSTFLTEQVEETYSNGAVVITYFNGSVKEVFPDGVTIVVSLFNGDIKRTMPDGRVVSSQTSVFVSFTMHG